MTQSERAGVRRSTSLNSTRAFGVSHCRCVARHGHCSRCLYGQQILSRYRTWLDKSLPPFEPTAKVAAAVAAERIGGVKSSIASSMVAATETLQSAGSPTTRTATPIPAEAASAESIAADDTLLQQFATAITDIKAMEAQLMKLWREELVVMLPELSPSDEQGVSPEGKPGSSSVAIALYLTSPPQRP